MSHAYKGGCACRAIRYEIAAEPVESNDCQCRQCQQQSGTGHSSYLSFVGAPVTVEARRRPGTLSGRAARSSAAPSARPAAHPSI